MKSLFFCLVFFIGLGLYSQEKDPKKEIEKTIMSLVAAWSEGDGDKFASSFSDDADFTTWFGMHLKGKQEIAFGHNMIFKEFYANTVWDLSIDHIKFVGDNVALVYCSGAVIAKGAPKAEEPDAVPLMVLNQRNGEWKILALQNTPFAVNEFRANGDINRMKRIARANMDKK